MWMAKSPASSSNSTYYAGLLATDIDDESTDHSIEKSSASKWRITIASGKWAQAFPIVARERSNASPLIHHRDEKVPARRGFRIECINNIDYTQLYKPLIAPKLRRYILVTVVFTRRTHMI